MKNPKLLENPGSNAEKEADRWVSGNDPMTGAQASYIATLAEETHQKLPAGELTKAEASKMIDELKHKAAAR